LILEKKRGTWNIFRRSFSLFIWFSHFLLAHVETTHTEQLVSGQKIEKDGIRLIGSLSERQTQEERRRTLLVRSFPSSNLFFSILSPFDVSRGFLH
jgi:hypothetical protein